MSRQTVGRALTLGTPVAAAAVTVAAAAVVERASVPGVAVDAAVQAVLVANAGLSAVAAAAGVAFLPGRTWMKVGGGVAYAALGLVAYGLLAGYVGNAILDALP